ncbi:MAG TPA: NUDIX hydrolase [Myxococcales bacterium]|nr:NUDIX hydrolase [Deltaproteobacteria bacterium]MBU50325.1 NUDIX hydrolase [Deltaproteobacteria bacterium]HAA54933.1 NUDIX hydrolase [Myxococcales bacterium]
MSRREHLLALLKDYKPFDEEEAGYHAEMVTLLSAEGDPFSRKHFVPGHFTSSAFILSPEKDSMLLIFHGKLHRWLQPGGHVDPEDQDILVSARREILEEVGIEDIPLQQEGIFDVDVHEIPALKGEPTHKHFDVRFLFVANDLNMTAGTDAKDARWVPFQEITEEISDRSVVRAIEKWVGDM